MYILFCIAFILIAIFEFVIAFAIKDIYDSLNFLNEIVDSRRIYYERCSSDE